MAEVRKAARSCYLCGQKGHIETECPLLNLMEKKREEEEEKPTKKKKVLKVKEDAKGGKKLLPSSRVTEVEIDAENTNGSDVADEYSDKESECVKNRLTRVKRVCVLWGKEQKDNGFPGGGKYWS